LKKLYMFQQYHLQQKWIDLIFNVCDVCKLTGRGDSLKTTFDDIAYFRMDDLSAWETASREASR
jgi:hypothetical protein